MHIIHNTVILTTPLTVRACAYVDLGEGEGKHLTAMFH